MVYGNPCARNAYSYHILGNRDDKILNQEKDNLT